jgi:hypothetical protein
MAEDAGCAVICTNCQGTGAVNFAYEEFKKRKNKNNIKRIFYRSFGYGHSAKDVTTQEGVKIKFTEGGCTYKEWKNGKLPLPVKDLYCPYVWDNLGMGDEPLPECRTKTNGHGSINQCTNYSNKKKCWEKYDKGEVTKEYKKVAFICNILKR